MTSETVLPYHLVGVSALQAPHLESDPLLSTEILPGPPSLVSVQQPAPKRDPRKPATLSYLPSSDPASTYSGGALIGGSEDSASRKRQRMDKK
jgi:hypothetical protein